MWTLLKLIVFVTAAAVVGYIVWFVPVGNETLAEHGSDIWRSDVVQHKVEGVRHGMRGELAAKLATMLPPALAPKGDEIPEQDRRSLDALLSRPR